MTVTDEVALGISNRSPSVMPNAWAMRRVTASVGLACSRSIWLSMDRLTPLALASASRDQPRVVRRFFTRLPRWRLIASAGSGVLVAGARRDLFGVVIRKERSRGLGESRCSGSRNRLSCIVEIYLAYRNLDSTISHVFPG